MEGTCRRSAFLPYCRQKKKMIMFGDHILASAQLFPKLMAFFSVCLICRFAWSVSRSDSVISEHASIWEPVS